MNKLVLDTNAYSELFRGNVIVAQALSEADEIFIPATVLGELLAGFKMGTREKANRSELKAFLAKPTVVILATDDGVAEHYGDLVRNLRKKGRTIPTNDIWIAAHALATGGALLTFDAHFDTMDGVLRWQG